MGGVILPSVILEKIISMFDPLVHYHNEDSTLVALSS